MKDSYSFDVDDAGLERCLPDAPRRLHPDLRPARLRVRHRQGRCPARWAARSPRSSWPSRRRRGHLRPLHALRLRRERRGRPGPRAPRRSRSTTLPAAHVEDTPDTPTIDTLVDHLNAAFPRDDRPWEAADTLKNVVVMLAHPDGTTRAARDRRARRPRGGPEAAGGAGRARRGRALHRGGLRGAPRAGQGLHRPRRAGGDERLGHPLPRRPARRRRHRAGSPAPTTTAAT